MPQVIQFIRRLAVAFSPELFVKRGYADLLGNELLAFFKLGDQARGFLIVEFALQQ